MPQYCTFHVMQCLFKITCMLDVVIALCTLQKSFKYIKHEQFYFHSAKADSSCEFVT